MRILASDDGSTDDTLTILEDRGVSVLEARTGKRGSAQNFCHIIAAASAQEDEYVALADQDDIWYPGRLARQVKILREGPFDAVSSSIDALYPDGTKKILRKDFPERRLDFVCQSPGPGSTYVFTPQAFAQLQNDLRSGAVDTNSHIDLFALPCDRSTIRATAAAIAADAGVRFDADEATELF